jgi:hypothetical protein
LLGVGGEPGGPNVLAALTTRAGATRLATTSLDVRLSQPTPRRRVPRRLTREVRGPIRRRARCSKGLHPGPARLRHRSRESTGPRRAPPDQPTTEQ